MRFWFLSVLFLFNFSSYAHEGPHGPQQKMAPHGGILKDGKALMAELVQEDSGVKIYFMTHASKVIPPANANIDIKAIQITDSKNKMVKIDVALEQDSMKIKFDRASSYRFKLTVPLSYDNKKDIITWQFEPQAN